MISQSSDALSFNKSNATSASTIVQPNVRQLEKAQSTWLTGSTTGGNDNGPQISLNDLEKVDHSSIPFDQFKDKHSTYNENSYTTTYDPSKLTEAQRRTANRVAWELENEDSKGNRHIAEERGQRELRDNDYENDNEEMRYSGVARSDNQPRPSFGKKGQAVQNKNKKQNNQQSSNNASKSSATTGVTASGNAIKSSQFKCFNSKNRKLSDAFQTMAKRHDKEMTTNKSQRGPLLRLDQAEKLSKEEFEK